MRSPPPLESAPWKSAGIRINIRRRIKEANRELERELKLQDTLVKDSTTIGAVGGKAAMNRRHVSFAQPLETEIEPNGSFPMADELDDSKDPSQTASICSNSSPIAEGLGVMENPSTGPPSRPYDDAGVLATSKTHKTKASTRQKEDLETPAINPPPTRKRKELDLLNNSTLDTTVESGSSKDVGEPPTPSTKAPGRKKRRTTRR